MANPPYPIPYDDITPEEYARRCKAIDNEIDAECWRFVRRVFMLILTLVVIVVAATQAFGELPVELHVCHHTTEARLLLRALTADTSYVTCEDTQAVRYYQSYLRECVVVKPALDTFVQIGKHQTKFTCPSLAYDSAAMTVLCLKREVDAHNAALKVYAEVGDELNRHWQTHIGMLTLGDEGTSNVLPWPWEEDYRITAWMPPRIER